MRVRIIIYPQAFSNNYYLFKGGGDRDSGAREKGLYPEPLGTAGRGLGLFPEKEPRIRCREGASLG